MKGFTVVNVEKAIKQFQMDRKICFNCADWDLAEFIIKYIKEDD